MGAVGFFVAPWLQSLRAVGQLGKHAHAACLRVEIGWVKSGTMSVVSFSFSFSDVSSSAPAWDKEW